MRLENKDTYTTVVFTIEHEGKTYKAVRSDDPFEEMRVDWILVDGDENEIFDTDPMYQEIIDFLTNEDEPKTDGAGFTAEDAKEEIDHRDALAATISLYLPKEMLTKDEYRVRIVDSLNHLEDYNIDENSKYHEALKMAYDNTDDMYDRYAKQFNQ